MKKIALLLIVPVFVLSGCTNSVVTDDVISVDDEGVTSFNSEVLAEELALTDDGELSGSEKVGLIFMREEEKLAHDVYATLYGLWGQNIFQNISNSEQTHTDAVGSLLEKFDVYDPSESTSLGEFRDDDLQDLYDDLIAGGESSLVDALEAGALVEEVDIIDLVKFMEETDNEDILLVYENLLKGSRNHLRSFVSNLEKQGVTYEPQLLSEEVYQDIIGSEIEQGNGGR